MSSLAWKSIQWALVDSRIHKYQTRIFKASKENNYYKVRSIQKRLLNSLDAKLVAVRRVTQLNKDKTSSNVNRQIFITDLQKEKLVEKLRLDGKVLPIQFTYSDKIGKVGKSTPISILTLKDKAKQVLCLLALEPEWEAKFEINSYGFRPGRYHYDALEAICMSLQNRLRKKNYQKYICLLYTSPSPRDQRGSRMPSSA